MGEDLTKCSPIISTILSPATPAYTFEIFPTSLLFNRG